MAEEPSNAENTGEEQAPEQPPDEETSEQPAKEEAPEQAPSADIAKRLTAMLDSAKKIITNPVGFFKDMPRTGGLVDPLLFVVAIGLLSGVLTVVLSLFKLSSFAAIVLMPIFAVIGSFIAGGILFGIWKLMGSEQNFEVAYRCCAYAFAIQPIVVLVGIIPYIGAIAGSLWGLYLVVLASTEVHKIEAQKAWIVFGVLAAIGILFSLHGERVRRRAENNMDELLRNVRGSTEELTPEEAGRAVGKFLSGMQKAAEEAAKKAERKSE